MQYHPIKYIANSSKNLWYLAKTKFTTPFINDTTVYLHK